MTLVEAGVEFPFLFGRAFIEAHGDADERALPEDFPSFSEGLSLRRRMRTSRACGQQLFPFLFGRAFIEA